ncbi:hypothetical protein BKA81DRAFT_421014 [Phyllosticta paracitricarpa]
MEALIKVFKQPQHTQLLPFHHFHLFPFEANPPVTLCAFPNPNTTPTLQLHTEVETMDATILRECRWQRTKAAQFENLVYDLSNQQIPGYNVPANEHQLIVEQLGLVAREACHLPHEACDVLVTDITACLLKASMAKSGRLEYIKIVMMDVLETARNLRGLKK